MITDTIEHIDENKNIVETGPKSNEQTNQTIVGTYKDDEIYCTICAMGIKNYKPKFFLDIEMNPACEDCCDTTDAEDNNFDPDEDYEEQLDENDF